jgi:hypothetical protein
MSEILHVTTKRKISDNEIMYDLENCLNDSFCSKQRKTEKSYVLSKNYNNMFYGNFVHKININNLAEFIDIKPHSITQIDTHTFYRTDNTNKIIKKTKHDWYNCVKIEVSLIKCIVQIQIFSNGMFFIKKCNSIFDAEDAIEKVLFEINSHKLKHLFYL